MVGCAYSNTQDRLAEPPESCDCVHASLSSTFSEVRVSERNLQQLEITFNGKLLLRETERINVLHELADQGTELEPETVEL